MKAVAELELARAQLPRGQRPSRGFPDHESGETPGSRIITPASSSAFGGWRGGFALGKHAKRRPSDSYQKSGSQRIAPFAEALVPESADVPCSPLSQSRCSVPIKSSKSSNSSDSEPPRFDRGIFNKGVQAIVDRLEDLSLTVPVRRFSEQGENRAGAGHRHVERT